MFPSQKNYSIDLKSKSTLYKKWSFPLRVSFVNVTKLEVFCGFGQIYWIMPYWKTSFSCKSINWLGSTWREHWLLAFYEIFNILFSYEDKDIGRFSNLHWCTFKKAQLPDKIYFVCYRVKWKIGKNKIISKQ